MAEYLNIPTEETQKEIAKALGKIADAQTIVDYSNAPGNKTLIAGTIEAGFLGFVPAVELITGDQLALDLGISAGRSQFSDTPWIKYIWKGKICFTPLKAIRHSIPWDDIYKAGAVYGNGKVGTLPPEGRLGTELSINGDDNSINTTGHFLGDKTEGMAYYDTVGEIGETVVLEGWSNEANNGEFVIESIIDSKIVVSGGALVTEEGSRTKKMYPKINAVIQDAKVTLGELEYKVRLFRGASSDPTDSYANSDRGSIGEENEWNAIILPLHEHAKLQNWNYPQYAGETEYWGVNLTDEDLRAHWQYGAGSYSWCQEARDDDQTFRRVVRGYYGASDLYANISWGSGSYIGWRPVLELSRTATL